MLLKCLKIFSKFNKFGEIFAENGRKNQAQKILRNRYFLENLGYTALFYEMHGKGYGGRVKGVFRNRLWGPNSSLGL